MKRPSLHLALACVLACGTAWAQSPRTTETLKQFFPDAQRFTARDVFLTPDMAARLQALSRSKVTERMVTFYAAEREGKPVGYAALHTHRVRTKNETLAVAFEPDGRLKRIDVAVFLEPEEYLPPRQWLAQFDGKDAGARLALGDDLMVLSGATLSARSIAETARWLLHAFKEAKVAAR